MLERTFVMVKPDGVSRGLVGEIIGRFERVGMKLKAIKTFVPPLEIVDKHYPATPELLKRLGDTTIKGLTELGKDIQKELGTTDPVEIGKLVRGWLMKSITSGQVVPMVWEGNNAIKNVRKLVGGTVPSDANPGTIRGDFSTDSPDAANVEFRSLYNLIHASGNPEEAKFEVGLWFPELKV